MVWNGTEPNESLSPRQLAALPHLLKPASITQQARNAGIGRSTLIRWLQDERFRSTLQDLRQDIFQFAQTELQAMSYKAAEVIEDALHNEDPRVRLLAAQAALKHADAARRAQDLERRVNFLVEAMELRKKPLWAIQ